MVADAITYCGDHFTIYTNTKSLCWTPETIKMLLIPNKMYQ